jgi:hypothetical protein
MPHYSTIGIEDKRICSGSVDLVKHFFGNRRKMKVIVIVVKEYF